MDEMSKNQRCRHCFPDITGSSIKFLCHKKCDNGAPCEVSDDDCNSCEHFNSRYIEYPITVVKINQKELDNFSLRSEDIGKLALIRPCSDNDKNETYIEIFLGELPCWQSISYNKNTMCLESQMVKNPAIFVPALKKVVYGCESWWKIVRDKNELDGHITDEMINSQWYVELVNGLNYNNK